MVKEEFDKQTAKTKGSSCFGVNCDVWIEQRRDKLKGKPGYVTSHPRCGVSITFISRSTFLVGKCAIDNHLIMDNLGNDAEKNLIAKLDSAKSKLVEIAQMKSKLVTENNKMKQSIEQLKGSAKDFKTELFEMDIKTLEEEYKALLSDRAGEIEYLQSLQKQIKQLKDISHMVKCACGVEYKVAMELCA
ncbi:hypothetical protein POTOM_059792 [Populus tomentosa]|uniref:Uncharacterized protein n=1 Tax=Populus tomentosa TaxID=118781 RepID=A0A8X8C0V6_POPTO|nr:hypothetical protein POTOM_059792 [Populus tomentosa]